MNIPVGLKGDNGFLNQMNMMWEWGWLPDGDPADTRLQKYFGLVILKKLYTIEWPSTVPSKL
jgi:hypothetical protein